MRSEQDIRWIQLSDLHMLKVKFTITQRAYRETIGCYYNELHVLISSDTNWRIRKAS